MPQGALTGTRIRERRLDRGLRQSDLARTVGISASYLNLIEHNRRRIGGKLLRDIASVLDVDAQVLSEGAEAAMLDTLRAAAGRLKPAGAEVARAEDFASRFPGWAGLVTEQDRRISALEARVATLADRMAHDPVLAAALHDIISSVTSIRSTSAILAGDDTIDPHWQGRFHRNIDDDARRLAHSSSALVSYLDASGSALSAGQAEPGGADQNAHSYLSPAEEVAAFLQTEAPRLHALDDPEGEPDAVTELTDAAARLSSDAARALAARHIGRMRADAVAMPLAPFREAMVELDGNPAALARRFDTAPAAVLRRIAAIPVAQGERPAGLAVCDGSGALVHLQPVAGFSLPRAGGSCPLWPLYRALSVPGVPLREEVVLPGNPGERFLCLAIAGPREIADFGTVPAMEATMLVLPWPASSAAEGRPVGLGCQICPRQSCSARREPSLIGD